MYKEIDINPKIVGLIGIGIRGGLVVPGFRNVETGLRKKQIDLVFMTRDIGQNTKKELLYYCNLHRILLVSMGSGKDWIESLKLNQKVLGIKRSSLSENLKKIVGV